MSESDSRATRHPLMRAVVTALRRHCRVQPRAGARLLVAVSGGADSVALLRALALLAGRRTFALELGVAHVQHHLRDPASEADAAFVESLATSLDLPYFRADLQLGPTVRTPGDIAAPRNLEARARRERYAALQAIADAYETDLIATAHHADDQLETLLMRMMRGTGVAGLRGIAWRRKLRLPRPAPDTDLAAPPDHPERRTPASPSRNATLIRPMLGSTHAQAIDFLNLLSQTWREDHTNADITRRRARLRRDVLPVLHDMQHDAAAKAVALADHARDVQRLIETEVGRHHERVARNSVSATLDRGEARLMPRVVLVALLRRLLRELDVPADRLSRRTLKPIVRAIRDRVGGQRRFELTQSMRITITRNEVTLGPV